jgi:hypothetical protein
LASQNGSLRIRTRLPVSHCLSVFRLRSWGNGAVSVFWQTSMRIEWFRPAFPGRNRRPGRSRPKSPRFRGGHTAPMEKRNAPVAGWETPAPKTSRFRRPADSRGLSGPCSPLSCLCRTGGSGLQSRYCPIAECESCCSERRLREPMQQYRAISAIFGDHLSCFACCHCAEAVESKSGRDYLRIPAFPYFSDCLRFSKTSFARVFEVIPTLVQDSLFVELSG